MLTKKKPNEKLWFNGWKLVFSLHGDEGFKSSYL